MNILNAVCNKCRSRELQVEIELDSYELAPHNALYLWCRHCREYVLSLRFEATKKELESRRMLALVTSKV